MSKITIRAVRRDDKERIVKAFQALDHRSIYQRFFSYKRRLSEAELQRVTECDGVNEVVLVATVGSGDYETIVGLGGYVRIDGGAEIAVVVEEDYQRRGVARRLLEHLRRIARANGITRFEADVLGENGPMLAFLRNCGLRVRTSNGHGVVHATLFLT